MTSALIRMNRIHAGDNDRKTFGRDDIASLASSINELGLIQAITVRPVGERFEIISGERRFRAHELLGRKVIDANVVDSLDPKAAEQMLAENLARVDLNPIEEANAYRKSVGLGGTHAGIARAAGVTLQRVEYRLGLLRLDDSVALQVSSGALGVRAALAVSELKPPNQRKVASEIILNQMSSASAVTLAAKALAREREAPLFDASSFELEIEEYAMEIRAAQVGAPSHKELLDLADALVNDPNVPNYVKQQIEALGKAPGPGERPRVLTVREPWLTAIVHFGKRIENRSWAPAASAIGEKLYLHSGAAMDKSLVDDYKGTAREGACRASGLNVAWWTDGGRLQGQVSNDAGETHPMSFGAITASSTLSGIHEGVEGRNCCGWGFEPSKGGVFHWELADVRPVTPYPCRGHQKIWRAPEDLPG